MFQILQLIIIPILAASVSVLVLSEIRKGHTLIYIFKPLSILLVIAVALIGFGSKGFTGIYGILVLIALIFSLAGDLFLLPPDSSKRFMLGLIAFLSAHLVYIAAFFTLGLPCRYDIVFGSFILIFAGFFFSKIRGNLGSMKVSVIFYILIISFMVTRAFSVLFILGLSSVQGWMIASGALLFFVSDIMLSANRYYKTWKYNRISLAFYFSGQLLIALSVGV